MSNEQYTSTDPDAWVIFEDRALAGGFTQIPNAIVRNPDLSMQAKYLYGLLLSYAWQDTETFPGLERLRKDTGAKTETLRKYIYELVEAGVLEVKRRGRGKTNLYIFKALTYGSDNPQRGRSRQPPTGEVKTTPNGGHYEYSVDKDTVNSRRASASPPDSSDIMDDTFGFFCQLANSLEVIVTPEDRKQTSRHFKDLKRIHTPDKRELNQVMTKMLEARASGFDMSPQKALEKVRSGGKGHLRAVPDAPRKTYRMDDGSVVG